MDLTFKVILEWDSEEQVFVVSVPSLPGCYTQGKNRPEALFGKPSMATSKP